MSSAHPAVAVDDVVVERDSGGSLVVSWTVTGECEEVELAWGTSPDGVDHSEPTTVPAAAGCYRIRNPAETRLYVSVSAAGHPGAVVGAERRIGMEGPVNFRDLGGYRTADGRCVRWGRVFRSDTLLLGDADLEAFAALGVRTVYDLRSESERQAVPNRLPSDAAPEVEVVPLVTEGRRTGLVDTFDRSDGEKFLASLYLHVLETAAPSIGRVVTGLADPDRLPAVFHCSAGKDRTGMVAAVLLSSLGVPQDTVLDDYQLTSRFRTSEHVRVSMARLGETVDLAPEVVAGILRTPRWALESALVDVGRRHGGVDGYLTGPAGVDASVPDRLRELLLVP